MQPPSSFHSVLSLIDLRLEILLQEQQHPQIRDNLAFFVFGTRLLPRTSSRASLSFSSCPQCILEVGTRIREKDSSNSRHHHQSPIYPIHPLRCCRRPQCIPLIKDYYYQDVSRNKPSEGADPKIFIYPPRSEETCAEEVP